MPRLCSRRSGKAPSRYAASCARRRSSSRPSSATTATIAAKNTAYVETTRNTIDVISSHIETVRAAMKAGAPPYTKARRR
jgi:hypothetical protein